MVALHNEAIMNATHAAPLLTSIPLGLLFLSLWTIVLLRTLVFAAVARRLVQLPLARMRRVYRLMVPTEQHAWSTLVTAMMVDAALAAAVAKFQLLRTTTGPVAALATFALMFVWFEVWFYFSHRLFHTKPLYRFHRAHHAGAVPQPLSAMAFSVAERFALVLGALGAAVAVSRVLSVSSAGLGAYFLVNYTINVLAHSNVEVFRAGFAVTPLGRILGTVTFHGMHHARHQGHYGLFTRVLDRLCGTEFKDYESAQHRAASGQGFERIGEKASHQQS
jgi:Delta7-sterol 5-desaturase